MSEIEQEIKRCYNKKSNYAYYDDLEYKLDGGSNFRNIDRVEREFLIGRDIIKTDLFLAEIVAKFSFADIKMIYTELVRMHEDPAYKDVTLPPISSMDNVRRGLKRLLGYGLVRAFRFKARESNNSKEILIFCISETGLTLIQKQLYTSVRNLDIMNSLEPPEEAFRRLVGNYCGQKISRNYNANKFLPGRKEYIRAMGSRHFVYSKLFFENDDKKTVHRVSVGTCRT